MKLSQIISCILLISCFVWMSSCDKDDTSPLATPLSISAINPTTGIPGTQVTITGENFGTEISNVKVYFNEKEASIITLTNTSITVVVPAKAGSGVVKIIVGTTTFTGPVFNYIPSMIVTTVAGGIAHFQNILHICTDSKGNIYVADESGHKIYKVTPAGNITTFAGNGNVTTGDIAYPNGICSDDNDNIYVTDGCKIKKITPAGVVTTIAGTQHASCGFANGTPSQATFGYPYGICTDASGDIYVAERSNHAIRKISGGITSTFAGGTYGDETGTGTAAQFRYPHDVCADANGNIYVLDQSNFKIKKITPAGVVSNFVGSIAGHRDGVGASARLNVVNALCIDPVSGNIYFGENTGGTPSDSTYIRMITPQEEVKTLMGNLYGYVDGPAKDAKFNPIYGIDIDFEGNLYVTEQSKLIRKISME